MPQETIQEQLFRLLIPKEILLSFELDQVKESDEIVEITLIEKELFPIQFSDKQLVLNGFMNPMELQSFPIQGKKCYLRLIRRRWKVRGTTDSTNCHNEYDFAAEGTKATKIFGDFLKENSW